MSFFLGTFVAVLEKNGYRSEKPLILWMETYLGVFSVKCNVIVASSFYCDMSCCWLKPKAAICCDGEHNLMESERNIV